jgi:hypothetical protein
MWFTEHWGRDKEESEETALWFANDLGFKFKKRKRFRHGLVRRHEYQKTYAGGLTKEGFLR